MCVVCSLAASALLLFAGAPPAPVRVIIYEDLQCSDCAVFHTMLRKQLLPRYPRGVSFEHRDFPLPKHAWARPAAIAARFFHERSPALAASFRAAVYRDRKKIQAASFPAYVAAFATARRVDAAAATAALDDPRLAALVEKDYQEGVARGISKTPTVFVNGRPFIETFPFAVIAAAIDAGLKVAAK